MGFVKIQPVLVICAIALPTAGAQILPDRPGPKLGYCRHLVPGIRERPGCHQDLCQTNADCPGIELCCFDGCAKACSRPQLVKPGQCPILSGRVLDESVLGGRSCSHDFECSGRQKCCQLSRDCPYGDCPRVCVSPQKRPRWI